QNILITAPERFSETVLEPHDFHIRPLNNQIEGPVKRVQVVILNLGARDIQDLQRISVVIGVELLHDPVLTLERLAGLWSPLAAWRCCDLSGEGGELRLCDRCFLVELTDGNERVVGARRERTGLSRSAIP